MACQEGCGKGIYPKNNNVNDALGINGSLKECSCCSTQRKSYPRGTNVNVELGISGDESLSGHYSKYDVPSLSLQSHYSKTDSPDNILHREMDLIDFLDMLGVDKETADKYYSEMRKMWFNNGIVEPTFYCVKVIDHDKNIIGVFYEDAWRRNRVYLGDVIFDFKESGRLFYLTHEIVHYMDFHANGQVDLTENETDTKARDILTAWGLW